MKKNIVLVALLGSVAVGAQIKSNLNISQNSIPGHTAFLDASSTPVWNNSNNPNIGKGLVFPRTDLTALSTMIAAPNGIPASYPNRLDGMVVYNVGTGTSKIGNVEVRPGFYYYENKTTNINGGTWKPIGGGISTAVSSNIYTADGVLTGDRKVTMGDKILTFEGNDGAKYLEVKNASWYPLVVNSTNAQGGGIAIHPNNLDNRAEFSVNERGDIRFYQNGSGDVIFVEKNGSLGGFVGINNTNPKVRLDVIGGGRFKRIGSASTIEIDTDNGQWGHLDFRRNDVKRWDIGMTNGEETGGEAGSNFFITSFKDDGSFNASGLFINRKTGYTGIGTSNPESGLDVAGEIIARGQNQIDAYFGGDNVPAVPGRPMNDVEIGSIKAGITDISLYNRADAKAMNLYANDLNAVGNIKSTALAGDGDKIVVANNDGTLTKGVSISNFATSNIYTADGTLTADRNVNQEGKWLNFKNGGVNITGHTGNYFPLVINTMHSEGNGGISMQPNGDQAKRVELNTTPQGNFRLWLDGDKIFVNRSTGNVGINTDKPLAKLHVSGGDILAGGSGQVEAYFGGDGVGGDVELGSTKAGVTDITLYNRADRAAMRLVSGDVNARGAIKATSLAGDGDKIVIANNDGTLTKGVSISNFATSNIYTADGSTNGDRTVSTADGFLTIKGNVWNPLVVNSEIVPTDPANNARGGLAVHPNDLEKRVEFATTKDGDSRIWLDGDKLFIKRATGNVGIGTVDPQAKLDVSGHLRVHNSNDHMLRLQKVGDDKVTDLIKRADGTFVISNGNAATNVWDEGRISITSTNVGIGTENPTEKLDVAGSIKSTALAGVGNRNVVADANGKLVIGEATSNVRTEPGNTTLTAADNNGYVYLTGAGTVTVPSSLPQGFSCIVVQQGDGQVTIAGDGVALQTARGTKTRTKYSAVGVIKRTTDTATITGDAVN